MALTRVLWSRSDAAPTHSINVYPSGGFIPMLDLPAPLTRRPLQLWPFDTTPCMNLVHQCKSVAFHRNMAVGSWFKISIMTSQVTCQVSYKSSRAKSKGIGTLRPSLILRISWKSLQFAQKWERETPQIGEVQHLISVEKMINGHEQMKSDKVCTWIWC
jgi:hypothetical protein